MIGQSLVIHFQYRRDVVINDECVGHLRDMFRRLREYVRVRGFLTQTPWYESPGPDGLPVFDGLVRATATCLVPLFQQQENVTVTAEALEPSAKDVVNAFIEEERIQN